MMSDLYYNIVLDFINLDIFKGKVIFIDSRILIYLSNILEKIQGNSELYSFFSREKGFNSFGIIIPESLGFTLGAFYPKDKNLLSEYEKLLKLGIELDIFVIKDNDYKETFFYEIDGIKFSPDYLQFLGKKTIFENRNNNRGEDILKNYNDKGIIYILSTWGFRFLNAGLSGSIQDIIKDSYYNVNLVFKIRFFLKNNDVYNGELLDKFFLNTVLYKSKTQILFFSILLKEGYKKIEDIAIGKILDNKEVLYIKNISTEFGKKYTGFVTKVYNKITANNFYKGNIMVSKNTNPEFLNAFYNSSIVCVDTKSELSHAAITCRELNIPLALGCDNLFFSVSNDEKITVDTIKKKIYLGID